ncbi:MAG: carboxymuconolactone decarboxylase family protein [Thermoplasmata archaeon]
MSEKYIEVKKFAEASLGQMPEVIELLFHMNENAAMEQFQENGILYLGRTSLPRKIMPLIAMSVALANGPKESAMIHFALAKKFGASNEEILDAIRATKMALMSSTLDASETINMNIKNSELSEKEESEKVLEKLKKDTGFVPDRLYEISDFSFNLLKEHLREKSNLLNPVKLESKYVFAISYAVSTSIHDHECQDVYLKQFIKKGGNSHEIEDILAITRFLVGNRAFVNAIDILRKMVNES